jgi:hypothetical protein
MRASFDNQIRNRQHKCRRQPLRLAPTSDLMPIMRIFMSGSHFSGVSGLAMLSVFRDIVILAAPGHKNHSVLSSAALSVLFSSQPVKYGTH